MISPVKLKAQKGKPHFGNARNRVILSLLYQESSFRFSFNQMPQFFFKY